MANKHLTEKQRKARNEYSRKWKAAHKKLVKLYNERSLKNRSKKTKKAKKTARKPKAVQTPVQQAA